MIRLSKILLFLLVTALLAWVLPWACGFLGGARQGNPFTLYSTVSGRFAWMESSERGLVRKDETGRTFTDKEFDSILPFFYYRQLLSDNRFPDSVRGVPVTPKEVQTGNFMFRSSPRQVNARPVGLYPLLESLSGRVDLESPGDAFCIDRHGITFIDCAANAVEAEKSDCFTAMMRRKGFVFPARVVAGNPTTRKEYDEGFFLVDSAGALFHLKQTCGRPFVRAVELPAGTEVARIFVTEFRGRRYFAFLTDRAGQFYVLTTGDYALHPVDVPPVDLTRQGLMIVGNPFDWTLKVSDPDGAEHLYAIDGERFSRIAEMHYPAPEPSLTERAAWYLFPFRLSFTSRLDNEVRPRFSDFSWRALALGLVLAIAYCALRRKNPVRLAVPCVFILVFGLYAFVALLLFAHRGAAGVEAGVRFAKAVLRLSQSNVRREARASRRNKAELVAELWTELFRRVRLTGRTRRIFRERVARFVRIAGLGSSDAVSGAWGCAPRTNKAGIGGVVGGAESGREAIFGA